MPLDNKGLKLVREYDIKKASDRLANTFGTIVGLTGGLATLLFIGDIRGSGNGCDCQPSWTPGFEINHDGQYQLSELAYLGGYIGVTVLGYWTI